MRDQENYVAMIPPYEKKSTTPKPNEGTTSENYTQRWLNSSVKHINRDKLSCTNHNGGIQKYLKL